MKSRVISRREVLAGIFSSGLFLLAPAAINAGDFRYDSDQTRNWPRNIVIEVQTRLDESGFDPGTIDGIYGALTAGAIRRFQRQHGMEVDGKISEELLNKLEIY